MTEIEMELCGKLMRKGGICGRCLDHKGRCRSIQCMQRQHERQRTPAYRERKRDYDRERKAARNA